MCDYCIYDAGEARYHCTREEIREDQHDMVLNGANCHLCRDSHDDVFAYDNQL